MALICAVYFCLTLLIKMCFLIIIFLCFALVPRTVDFHWYWYRIHKVLCQNNLHDILILCALNIFFFLLIQKSSNL